MRKAKPMSHGEKKASPARPLRVFMLNIALHRTTESFLSWQPDSHEAKPCHSRSPKTPSV